MSVRETNKQICRDYFKAFLARDTAWMAKHIAPDFLRHDPGLPFEVRGPQGVAQLHDALLPAFPDMALPLEDFVAEGEKVLVRLRVKGTHTGAFGDIAATGHRIDIGVLDLFQIRDGVLVEHWALLDNLGMLKQLGALPARPIRDDPSHRRRTMQLLANTTSPFVRIARTAMIEKGIDLEPTLVDPWADDARLRAANAATRVPTLVLDDGTPLTEALLIVQWLEATRPAPDWPSLIGPASGAASVLSRAGIAIGAIEASVITIITRKVTAPTLFDDTPVGLRRRRAMIEGMQRLEAQADAIARTGAPTLDAIAAVTLYDYQQLRYSDQPWLPKTPRLQVLAQAWRGRASFSTTMPYLV